MLLVLQFKGSIIKNIINIELKYLTFDYIFYTSWCLFLPMYISQFSLKFSILNCIFVLNKVVLYSSQNISYHISSGTNKISRKYDEPFKFTKFGK